MPTAYASRPLHAPSGRVSPSDLLIWLAIVAGIGLALAAGLAWLTGANGYAVGWIWIVPTALLCALAQAAVARSLCRNRAIGFGVGLVAGVMTVGGMYHIDQCSRWDVGWERIDRIPGYITFRMETDGWWARDGRMPLVWPLPAQAGIDPWLPPRIQWSWHWATVLGEVIFLVLFPATLAWKRAGRPFSEPRGEWFAQDRASLTRESAAALREALSKGSIDWWTAHAVEKSLTHESHVVVTIWYCPRRDAATDAESEVYLSMGAGSPVLLEPEEAAALTAVFPGLADLALPEAARFESETPTGRIGVDDPAAARLIKIPGPHIGRAQTTSVRWRGKAIAGALSILPLFILLAFAGSVWLGHIILSLLGLSDLWLIGYLAVGGIALLLYVQRWYGPGGGVPFARLVQYSWNVVRDQAAERPDALFPPNAAGVIYAEVAPRRAWSDLSGRQSECEGGLLLIDPEGAGLLYEGDRHRYIMPLASIQRLDLEEVTRMGTTDGLYAVVLVLRLASGDTHELPLIPLAGLDGANPWERAANLRDQIAWQIEGTVAMSRDPAGETV